MMSAWFEARHRGVVMGWWCTNYAPGAFLATTIGTFAATSSLLFAPGWQRVFRCSCATVRWRPRPGRNPGRASPSFFTWPTAATSCLTERLGFSPAGAGYSSSVFELGGFAGVVPSGYVSDKLFQARRFPVGALGKMGLGCACLLPTMAGLTGTGIIVPAIALIGLLNLGPDTLLGGATASGFVNGTGSTGQFLSPFLWWRAGCCLR